jgi:hypothetical protein
LVPAFIRFGTQLFILVPISFILVPVSLILVLRFF